MIKILFTIPNFNTAGSGKALLNLAHHLDKAQFDVHIACKTNEGSLFKTVQESQIPLHVFDYEAPMRPLSKLISKSFEIRRKIKAINPDIIHSFHYNNNYGEVLPAKWAGVKWIFTKKNMNWGSDGANAWKIRSALANKIILQNTEMKAQFYPRSLKTVLIERGINLPSFSPSALDVAVLSSLNTRASHRILITVANLVPVKGIEFLVEAFSNLTKDFPEWKLWLIGDDTSEYADSLKSTVKDKGLNHQIIFSGKRENMRLYLDHAEVFVLPTKETGEGSPVALIEAMANGKVVLGSDVPGIKDQLIHYPEYLFKAEDTAALMQKLKWIMRNTPEENKKLGESFRDLAEKKYSIQREVKEHEYVYANLMR